ncbi:cell division ATP-binding protein FtsE [Gephyromycinifex aptenodytis]|uniref:cell division ATP-binding protein FtsE n=1 Tax=Gephyromycinifex aptenodytis TaxID=2716227 RepID=UPI00144672C1|nr:ATP-binding cassette domain-containing protein [Gephyromycinifex aptenodytis]
MICFENVVKAYGRNTARPALDGVDLRLDAGEFVFLVGPSGSGKSTLVRLALREEKATSGRLEVAGRDLMRMPRRQVPKLRREVGAVFQDFRLLPEKTVYENVAYVLHVLGVKPAQVRVDVPAALESVGLADLAGRRPHELSGGEQQRVAVARALVRKPALLLADEPTGNLDPAASFDLVRLLAEINANGTTVLMATHNDAIVDVHRRRVVELAAGKIVRDEKDGAYGVTRGEARYRSPQPRLTADTDTGTESSTESEAGAEAEAEADETTGKTQ